LVDVFAATLAIPSAELDPDATFSDLGVESVLLGELLTKVEAGVGRPLEPTVLLDNPTLRRLAVHLNATAPDAPGPVPADRVGAGAAVAGPVPDRRIAVIGMACRLPGAPDLRSFWELLRSGGSAVTEVPPGRWDVSRLYRPERATGRSISRWGGFVDGVEDFDPDYFGMSDDEAKNLDPAIRMTLEATAACLSDAGYVADEVRGRDVGIFMGARMSGYRRRIGLADAASGLGGDQNFIAARVAHQYDLRGPALVVDSACSSALVAVHLAIGSLLAGESPVALAGGVEVLLDEEPYLEFSHAGALSPDGRCATFARDANGFVPGEGCGVLLLKPLSAALRDGDRVHAVIESVAVGNDGRTMGLTTPNPAAQGQVVRAALARAGRRADEIGMVEAHGTATKIGDPIELRALTDVYREHSDRVGYCAIGSVKSNLGHLLSAAGVAGLVKLLLAIEHGEIPATLYCADPNPRFDFATSPFFPVTRARAWPTGTRVGAVSAFGLGGTNAHLIAAACPSTAPSPTRGPLPAPVFRRRRLWWDRPATAESTAEPTTEPTTLHGRANGDGRANGNARANGNGNGRPQRLVTSVLDLSFRPAAPEAS
jgi:acyl transferase domain-containing protein